jgi:hypothetical protein
MNATTNTVRSADSAFVKSASAAARYVVTVGETSCEVRAHTIAIFADLLGFEQEMEVAGQAADRHLIADLLDSRMIAPPRAVRRRQRTVSSRAMFYGAAGG